MLLITALIVGPCKNGFAATGPLIEPLLVKSVYTEDGSSAVYVEFQSGAMPGCYGNAGGYLFFTNARFNQLYAALLMITSVGGVRAHVLFTLNSSSGEWSDCTITGIWLRPA
jgi:hypothetical protein